MLSFKSRITPTRTRFIVRYTLWLIAVAAFFLLNNYYGWIKVSPYLLSLYTVIFVSGLIRESKRFFIQQVNIDEENRSVAFNCFQFWQGQKTFKEPFDELKVKIVPPILAWRYTSPTVFFFRNDPGDFYVSNRKDHFSKETLNALTEALRRLTSPAKKSEASKLSPNTKPSQLIGRATEL
jgi:hypothetical protein